MVKTIQALGDMNADEVAKTIGYSRGHLSRLMNEESSNEDSLHVEALLEEKHKKLLQGVTFATGKGFTPEQLYAMFMSVTATQTDILKSIESKMARETTLARIEPNLETTMAAALTAVKNQDDGMAEIRRLLSEARKKDPSRGAGKGRGGIGGGSESIGKKPKKGM